MAKTELKRIYTDFIFNFDDLYNIENFDTHWIYRSKYSLSKIIYPTMGKFVKKNCLKYDEYIKINDISFYPTPIHCGEHYKSESNLFTCETVIDVNIKDKRYMDKFKKHIEKYKSYMPIEEFNYEEFVIDEKIKEICFNLTRLLSPFKTFIINDYMYDVNYIEDNELYIYDVFVENAS